MSEFFDQLKALASQYKGAGAKFGKSFMVEYFLEANHDDIVSQLATVLTYITPEDIKTYIREGTALPIPPSFFHRIKNFEDWLAGFEPERFFHLIAEANPATATAIMEMGEEGVLYMVKFKQFMLDNVRALNAESQAALETEPAETAETDDKPLSQQHFNIKVAGEDSGLSESKIPSPNPPPEGPRKKLVCDACNESWLVLEEDVAQVIECPFCHAPA